MKILKQVDKYFWIFLFASIILGLFFSAPFRPLENYVIYIVMSIIGLLFLKVDIIDIVTHIRQPFFLLYIAFINLVVTPVITYFVFRGLTPELTPGLVLLAALPSGVTSAAFTDMMKGRTSLTLTTIIVTNLFSIITIPFVFYILFNQSMEISVMDLGMNLLKVFAIPFFIAKVLKHVLVQDLVTKLQDYYNIIIVSLLSLMIAVSTSFASDYIIEHLKVSYSALAYLFLAYIIFQLIGYFSVFWHSKGEKVAVSNANMLTNNILGIVLALAFLTEDILHLVVMSVIPWSVMIVAKHWYKRFLP